MGGKCRTLGFSIRVLNICGETQNDCSHWKWGWFSAWTLQKCLEVETLWRGLVGTTMAESTVWDLRHPFHQGHKNVCKIVDNACQDLLVKVNSILAWRIVLWFVNPVDLLSTKYRREFIHCCSERCVVEKLLLTIFTEAIKNSLSVPVNLAEKRINTCWTETLGLVFNSLNPQARNS